MIHFADSQWRIDDFLRARPCFIGSTIFFGLVDDLFWLDFLRARPRFISARRFSLRSSMIYFGSHRSFRFRRQCLRASTIYFGSTIFFGLVDDLFCSSMIYLDRRFCSGSPTIYFGSRSYFGSKIWLVDDLLGSTAFFGIIPPFRFYSGLGTSSFHILFGLRHLFIRYFIRISISSF